MNWFDWKKFRNSSIYVTHNLPETPTERYKISMLRVAGYIAIYTFFSWMVLILILGITPLKDFLFVLDEQEFKIQAEKAEDLQKKVEILTAQLQKIASSNEKMKYAMKLAQQDSTDSTNNIYKKLKKPINTKLELGGNILTAFNLLIEKIFADSSKYSSLHFLQPVNGFISQEFLPDKGHFGIDFGTKKGSPVYASAGGLVIFADYTPENGNTIIIEHEQNYITIYQHCASLLKKVRDIVKQGEPIAFSGNSGKNTTGPHLHFEMWQNGKPVNPEKFLIK
jgi:murein DD-endopeptidase MepM/ murein hydrolase activator NlpD